MNTYHHTLLLLMCTVSLFFSADVLSQEKKTQAGDSDPVNVPTFRAELPGSGSSQMLAKINTDLLPDKISAIGQQKRIIHTRRNQTIDDSVYSNSHRYSEPPHSEYLHNEQPPIGQPHIEQSVSGKEIAHLRQLFLRAEDYIKKGDDRHYFLLADQLQGYPLYPYLQYQWLKKHMGDTQKIKDFLAQNKASRYAPLLKYRWLYHLAKHRRWKTFLQYYNDNHDKTLVCYFHRAQFYLGEKQLALKAAQKLWSVGYSQPEECNPLFTQLKHSALFTQDLRWQRFNAALRNNKVSLALYVKKLMPAENQAIASLWLKLHKHPRRSFQQLLALPVNAQTRLMFFHAISRMAAKDVNTAISLWDADKKHFTMDKAQTEKMEKCLALALVFSREPGAYSRFSQLDLRDDSSRTWRIRAALIEQNWTGVIDAITALDKVDRQQEKWQYWLARAYLQTGKAKEAEKIFSRLSTRRSYYGYLAADRVNRIYQLSDSPLQVTADEINALKQRKSFRAVSEFIVLNKINEAKLQWWYALRSLDKQEIIVAAKLAQQWQWDEIAIFTIAKVKLWDDVVMRFPLAYSASVYRNALRQKLNPAILFGLIRRESAFNENAYSPTGARGLMQIMPRTARQIARHFNERWRGNRSLFDPVKNLKYGAYYYQKLLNRYNGHYAIALAAYNAGPERVKRWLPRNEMVPADIWIETIPYEETRDYVISVLTYTLIYQQRTNNDTLTMADLTQDVPPYGKSH